MENLNDAEFGSNKDGEEAPILVAQRYLNIFRQVHIFNKAKRDQFDDELLALQPNITDFFKKMPGGRLLVEHIEEVKTERGISFVKSNKDDFTGGYGGDAQSSGGAPQTVAGGPVVGGNLVLGESFAEIFSKSMAEAFKQLPTPVSGVPVSGGNVSVDLGNAFDVLAEEIRTSRASLLDVLKETRSITDSVIASQVSISRILEGILSARSRDESDVANLNNRIIASQASISKLLESLYTNNSTKAPTINTSSIDIEGRLQDFKREIKQELDSSINKIQALVNSLNYNQTKNFTSNIEEDEDIVIQEEASIIENDATNKRKKKKKKKKGNQSVETTALTTALTTASDVIANELSFDEDFEPIDGTIRNSQYKHHDNFDNINLNEPPFGEDINENADDDTVDDLYFSLPEQSIGVDIEEDNTPFPAEEEGLDSFDNDDLEFTLPDEIAPSNSEDNDNSQEHVSFDSFNVSDSDLHLQSNEINDIDGLSGVASSFDDMLYKLSSQTSEEEKNETEDAIVFDDINLDNFSDFDTLTEATDTSNEKDDISSLSFDDNIEFSEDLHDEVETPSFDLSNFENTTIENDNTENIENVFEDTPLDDDISTNFDEVTVEDNPEEINKSEIEGFNNNFNDVDLDNFTTNETVEKNNEEIDFNFDDLSMEDKLEDINTDKTEDFSDIDLDSFTIDETVETNNKVTDFNFDDLISTSVEDTAENAEQDNLPEESLDSIDLSSFEEDITSASNENDVNSTLDNFSDEEIEEKEILSEFDSKQSRYSAELDKIREALTSDSVDLSSLDEPIALDEYSDDENVEEDTDTSNQDDDWEYEYVEENTPSEQTSNDTDETEDATSSNDEWEWEYVEEENNSTASSDDEEWEYVDENGNPVTPSDNEEWEWEYVEEEETDNNEQ